MNYWDPAPRRQPRSGDVLHITREASVQFGVPFLFRVISVDQTPTYAGWVWLHGYQLDSAGNAKMSRNIFVQLCGLRYVSAPATPKRRPRNTRNAAAAPRARNAATSVPAPPAAERTR